MLSRLQLKNLPYRQYRQISSNLCVTHKLATFPNSQYPQFFKHKIELTKKFGTFLSQDPVSTPKSWVKGNFCSFLKSFLFAEIVISDKICGIFSMQAFQNMYEALFHQNCAHWTPITQQEPQI